MSLPISNENMTINEIFEQPAIKEIENNIIKADAEDKQLKVSGFKHSWNSNVVSTLLTIRKTLLNETFTMNDYYKQLLCDLNDVLKEQRETVNEKITTVFKSVVNARINCDMQVGCYLHIGEKYPENHPVQTVRSKHIWKILRDSWNSDDNNNNGFGDYIQFFNGKANDFKASEDKLIRFHEKDCHKKVYGQDVCPILYHLYTLSQFSVYDLLWTRSFDMTIQLLANSKNYESDDVDDVEAPDWFDF